jgi:hypothetical protein
VYRLADNLFQPLCHESRREFEAGDGKELKAGDRKEGNMFALHSSSALCCNLFDYWRQLGQMDCIAKACKIPSRNIGNIEFEAKLPIDSSFERPPNVDILVRYGRGGRCRAVGFECKFTEPYLGPHKGLDQKYLGLNQLWDQMPNSRALAEKISPADGSFRHLHAAQLLKHLLGLTRAFGKTRFRLFYLWYHAPGEEGTAHALEVNDFADRLRADGVNFQSRTYQDVICHLGKKCRDRHAGYTDWLAERYL